MAECADEKGDHSGHIAGYMGTGSTVDMAVEKVMDWDVPFAREFKPGCLF